MVILYENREKSELSAYNRTLRRILRRIFIAENFLPNFFSPQFQSETACVQAVMRCVILIEIIVNQ